ncbi:helix-turn-helix transcriptional regulator [Streptomyces sp. AC495_CC817]|uniref:helix-turn-helix domain-containing protein n=1 Tax=Streptomyces sp. AC495_CC817 TaxID=2823900 RepID=UPI001C26BAFA|nr:helix-turn-helix transcriptional regulator [Streptomyces sp. AC495_CC817]
MVNERGGPNWQAVLDATAQFQLRRADLLAADAEDRADVRVFRDPGLNESLMEDSRRWTSLLSVRTSATVAELRETLPNNRAIMAAGLSMISLFDWDGTTPAARALLRAEADPSYRFTHAPMQMKIIDDAEVLLQGPYLPSGRTVLAVRSPEILQAATKYWSAVLRTSWPAAEDADVFSHDAQLTAEMFTERQLYIARLLGEGMTDQWIADALGVSIRTVRYEIRRLLDRAGAGTRFEAGVKLARLVPPR